MRGPAVIALSLCSACLLPASSLATPYDAEYVFGDSLSDTGNLAATGLIQSFAGQPIANFPDPPSYHDSFTNGPVAVQALATRLGLNADPSLWVTGFQDIHDLFGPGFVPGTNYAVGAATAAASIPMGGIPGINLPQQVAAYIDHSAGGSADPNALYTILIGGNDIRNAALFGTGLPAVQNGVTAEIAAVNDLLGAGARHLLVVNVPNVGVIPEFAQDTPTDAAAATLYTQDYNSLLATDLAGVTLPGNATLAQFDLYSFASEIIADAAQLGFINTTDRCFTETPLSAAATPQCGPDGDLVNSFIYWDDIHPSGHQQALWSQGMFEALNGVPEPSPVPEPATAAILAVGLLGLLRLRHRTL